jgi:hypothetical protein
MATAGHGNCGYLPLTDCPGIEPDQSGNQPPGLYSANTYTELFMPASTHTRLAPIAALLLALPALALETGELQLKEGYVDPASGLRIEKVVVSEQDQTQAVTVSLPGSVGTIDEVVVTAPKDKTPVKQKKRFEWLKDFEHDRYGLVIYLDRNQGLPLRLYFANEQANEQAGDKAGNNVKP